MPKINDSIATPDGICPVQLFTPDGTGPWPAIVMFPDAGGARGTIFQMADKLAGFGYAVLVPDMYYRQGDWKPFDMATAFGNEQERNRLMSMLASVTPEHVTTDVSAFFDYLTGRPEVGGERFGVCGYCMGGRIALFVTGTFGDRVVAAASFHGGGLVSDSPASPHLLADRMTATVYVAGAVNDATYTPEDAEQLDKALTAAGVRHRMEWYEGEHGFAVPDNPRYNAAAAERHWKAITEFFASELTS